MKKIITIGLLSALLLFSVGAPVLAVSVGTIPGAGDIGVGNEGNTSTVGGVADLIIRIIKWIYTFIFILAVLFILIAAFDFVTSKGDPDKVKKATDNLKYAAIGIAVALLSYAVVAVIKSLVSSNM